MDAGLAQGFGEGQTLIAREAGADLLKGRHNWNLNYLGCRRVLRGWDFDIVTFAWGQSLLPGNEQRGYWGSQAADQPGSDNILGIKNPAVDEMITKIIMAKTRDDLVAATKALDRILLWNQYVVPQWGYAKLRTARWNRFGRPDPLPKYGMSAFPTVWWWDADRAAKTGGKRTQ